MLSNDDIQRLRLFVAQVNKVRKSSFISSFPDNIGFTIHFSDEDGYNSRLSPNFPPDEQLESFLIRFRQLYQDGPTNFRSICNLIYTKTEDKSIADRVSRAHGVYNNRLSKSPDVVFVYNNTTLSPSKIIDLWLNGDHFHLDDSKRVDLENIRKTTGDLFLILFVSPLCDLFRLACYVSNIISSEILHEARN